MDSRKQDDEELKIKLDRVIEKSNAQKKLLKKILTQINKQSEGMEIKAKSKKKL
jgi:hypothetical protein